MQIETVPEWLGTALIGASLAFVGYVGKQMVEWVRDLRAQERLRRARLTELLALIRAGDVAWEVQSSNRDRLARLIRERDPELRKASHGFDRLFSIAFPAMTNAERELHEVVRATTVHTFAPLNEELLEWLRADTVFRVRTAGTSPRSAVATFLEELEAHLILWRAKYKAWIPDHPERALVYLLDEQRHGIGFPSGGAALVDRLLKTRWIGA